MSIRYVNKVARMLWFGYVDTALDELRMLAEPPRALDCRVAALTELLRWRATRGELFDATETAEQALALCEGTDIPDETFAIAVDVFTSSGATERALALLAEAPPHIADNSDAFLRRFNALTAGARDGAESRAANLGLVNTVFTRRGCVPVRLADPRADVTLDNICAASAPDASGNRLVSIIMPAFNSQDTIGYALGGLLSQTWSELEIVVVDDGSSDATLEIASSTGDARVRVERNPGKGAYEARNHGLGCTLGEFVTVHDADDWSHPEKIEHQVRPLLADDSLVATMSAWVRTRHQLYFPEPSLRPRLNKVTPNHSSFLARRMAFEVLGSWDNPMVSGDTEQIERCARFYGRRATRTVLPDVPLSFGLRSETSLTAAADGTGVLTLYHLAGSRRLYRDQYMRWHRSSRFVATLPLDPARRSVPFVRPRTLDRGQSRDSSADVVVMGDFTRDAVGIDSTLYELAEFVAAGNRVALLHVPVYEREVHRFRGTLPLGPLAPTLLEIVDGERAWLMSAGESVTAKLLLVRPARVLEHPVVGLPSVVADRTVIVVDPPDDSTPFEPARWTAWLAKLQPHRVAWYPADSSVREFMGSHAGVLALGLPVAAQDWSEIPGWGHLVEPDSDAESP